VRQVVQWRGNLALSAGVIGHIENVTHYILRLHLRSHLAIRRSLDLTPGLGAHQAATMTVLEVLVGRSPSNVVERNISNLFRASKRCLLQTLTVLCWNGLGALRCRRGILNLNFLNNMWLELIKIL
jgi:hypothetical protein